MLNFTSIPVSSDMVMSTPQFELSDRIHELEKQIPAIEEYRKYKVYYKNYTSLEGKSKKKYGENCRYELDQYHECRKKMKELFPDGIIPKIKDLQDELKKAREDYAKMSAERKALKKEADRLSRLAQQKRDSQRTLARYVREGDTLYIESISRLGRSTKDLLNIIDTLTEKGVTLISHKENIDTDTPAGKFMLTVFAALSQLEREQLKQRQREGIEIAKAQGKYTGRKPIEIDWTRFGQLYGEWKSKNITGRDFMRRMGLSANTFYRRVREYEAEHGIAEPTSA